MNQFSIWLSNELNKRGWKTSELARRGGIHTGTLSNILSGARNPGPKTIRLIARGLGVPQEVVFQKAGVLPPAPADVKYENELLFNFRQLDTRAKLDALAIVRSLRERRAPYGKAKKNDA